MQVIKKMRAALFALIAIAVIPSFALAGEYTDKSYHDPSDDINTYKHPNQRSFTGPFDYAPVNEVDRITPAPAGRCNQFTFDATKSHDIDKQKLSVLWDFGDGTTSDKPVVTKTYEKPGDYTVTLTVKDSSGMPCDTGVNSTKVTVNYPPTCVLGEDKKACVGESVGFDASGSTASGPATYQWDFGDGETGEGVNPTHVYQKAGKYHVRVVVDDGKGTQCSTAACAQTVEVGDRPTVDLTGPETICTGRTASFDAKGSGGGQYRWDFGDGTTWEGGSRASHTYQKGGDYAVTVTVDNGQGFSCSVAADSTHIKVSSTPIADAGENVACCVGQTTKFDASGSSSPDGSALSYHWDFGDDQTSDEKTATHTYEKSGHYRVVLTVKDNSGSDCGISSDSFVAQVNTQPQAIIEVR
jgi:PKD repeat protein